LDPVAHCLRGLPVSRFNAGCKRLLQTFQLLFVTGQNGWVESDRLGWWRNPSSSALIVLRSLFSDVDFGPSTTVSPSPFGYGINKPPDLAVAHD